MQDSDYPSGWIPLIEALAEADAALGADAWGEMKGVILRERLHLMGRVDGDTVKIDPGWLNDLAAFGWSSR